MTLLTNQFLSSKKITSLNTTLDAYPVNGVSTNSTSFERHYESTNCMSFKDIMTMLCNVFPCVYVYYTRSNSTYKIMVVVDHEENKQNNSKNKLHGILSQDGVNT